MFFGTHCNDPTKAVPMSTHYTFYWRNNKQKKQQQKNPRKPPKNWAPCSVSSVSDCRTRAHKLKPNSAT